MKKIPKMNEAAWVLGILFCTLGIALCTKANLGLSMIAAPIYIIHIKLVTFFPWYTQGTSEYIFQACLIIVTALVCRRFKVKYIFTFFTAFLSGITLDFWLSLIDGYAVPESMAVRAALFALGEGATALAIAFYFRTDMPIQGYELLVKEISSAYSLDITRAKQVNDALYLLGSVALALLLNRSLQGLGVGTVIITLVNAPLISLFGKMLDAVFVFDRLFKRR